MPLLYLDTTQPTTLMAMAANNISTPVQGAFFISNSYLTDGCPKVYIHKNDIAAQG